MFSNEGFKNEVDPVALAAISPDFYFENFEADEEFYGTLVEQINKHENLAIDYKVVDIARIPQNESIIKTKDFKSIFVPINENLLICYYNVSLYLY